MRKAAAKKAIVLPDAEKKLAEIEHDSFHVIIQDLDEELYGPYSFDSKSQFLAHLAEDMLDVNSHNILNIFPVNTCIIQKVEYQDVSFDNRKR